MSRRPIIQMEQVSFAYAPSPQEPTIDQVTTKVEPGQWVSIVGANGCGKSTLVKLLNGLLPKCEGNIYIDGLELTNDTVYEIRQKIGMIFQNPENQFVGTTVLEDLVFGMENIGLDRQTMEMRIDRIANQLHISTLLNRHPGELSGGQKQRAAIAAILAMEPKIIIFDEATSMLDEEARNEVVDLMVHMRASGQYTILSITHDADEIAASDRVWVLEHGKLIADEAPDAIFANSDLMAKCRLRLPFMRRLTEHLQEYYRLPAFHAKDETELVEELCQYYSVM